LAAAFAVIALPPACHADTLESPPLVPQHEELPLPARPFVTKTCLHVVKVLTSKPGTVLGRPVLMYSPTWGEVWRVDFSLPGLAATDGVNRVVCWLPPHQQWSIQIAIGQRIAPLDR
jgi:hypothetical protein